MKKMAYSAIVAFLLFGIVLSGCSNSKESNGSDKGKVTITVWNIMPELDDSLAEFIDKFEDEHKDIKVKLTNIPTNEQEQSMQTALKEDTLPDVIPSGGTFTLPQLVKANKLHKLDSLFPDKVQDEYVDGSFLNGVGTENGHVYNLPLMSPNHNMMMMYYNKDVLKKYGINESDVPKTWSDLMTVGKKIYKKSDGQIYGLIGSNEGWVYRDIMYQMASAITPETPRKINYKTGRPDVNSKGKIETFKFYKKMLDNHVLAPQSLEGDMSKSEALFAAGKAAFLFQADSAGGALYNKDHFKGFGVAPLPTKKGKTQYFPKPINTPSGFEVSKDTKHWPQVKTFLQYVIDHIYGKTLGKAGYIPAKKDVKTEADFPQFKKINKITQNIGILYPNLGTRSTKLAEFWSEYDGKLDKTSIQDVAVGYLSGEVKNIGKELGKINKSDNKAFDNALKEDKWKDIKAGDFKFPNWTPGQPYTEEDYKDHKK